MPIRVVPGNTITSSNVSANKQYIDGRNIQNLKALGALPDVKGSVADRVDGILDNKPADGKFEIDELVKVEDPAHFATLFPDEQAAEKTLWKALEWDNVPPAAPAPTAPPLASTDDSVNPGAFDFNKPVKITDLPQPLQRTAQRVQLVLNADHDATTIQLDDLNRAISAPGRFTPGDVTDMNNTVDAIKNILRGTGALAAKVKVPDPGVKDFAIPNPGSVKLNLHTETSIHESRSITAAGTSQQSFSAQVLCSRTQSITVDVPQGKQALMINQATGEERLFAQTGDDKQQPLAAGTWRLELWQNGARVESSDVNIPPHSNDNLDLTPFLNYQLEGSSGPLARNLTDAQNTVNRWGNYQNTISASYDFSSTPAAPDPGKAQIAKATDSLPSGLKPGRYTWNTQNFGAVTLDVYPENVLKTTVNGNTTTMHTVPNSGVYYDNGGNGASSATPRVMYDPNSHTLTVTAGGFAPPPGQYYQTSRSENVVVTDSLRTG
jgi:hypothetical protein